MQECMSKLQAGQILLGWKDNWRGTSILPFWVLLLGKDDNGRATNNKHGNIKMTLMDNKGTNFSVGSIQRHARMLCVLKNVSLSLLPLKIYRLAGLRIGLGDIWRGI